MSARLVALSTAPSAEVAEQLARALVGEGLAACVNVVPGVTSYYRWKGELQRDAEWLLVIKTRAGRLEAIEAALARLHPYEVPELLALKVEDGLPSYLAWLDESTAVGGA